MNTHQIRVIGVLMIALGVLIPVAYVIKPLRLLFDFFMSLAGPLQVAFSLAAVGLILLISSLISERISDRNAEGSLKD